MSSTNKTSHYNLSQYIGTDKPTYLADYNTDMSNIDTGIYGAKSTADTNTNSIGTLSSLTTDTKSNLVGAINEVDSHADTNAGNISTNTTNIASNTSHIGVMANLDTTEKSNLVGAVNELKAAISNFNLTTYQSLTNITGTNCTIGANTVNLAKNSDGSLAKVYGTIAITTTATGDSKVVIAGSGLAPESDITINCAGIMRINGSSFSPTQFDIVIKTNGNIEITKYLETSQNCLLILLPCLYFIKDFGDTPINQ